MKLLLPRTFIAALGAALLVAAFWADSRALALAATIALLAAEALALAGLTASNETVTQRALLGIGESLCGLAVSVLEPAAMLVALAQIVYSVIASGMSTVSLSLGKPLVKPRGETMRRILGVAANVGLCLIVLQAAGKLDIHRDLGLGSRDLALLCTALVIVASARTITEIGLNAKWTK